jgi:4-amino-4-deoxy-L-arabinose transferase-like glycosyltransferase
MTDRSADEPATRDAWTGRTAVAIVFAFVLVSLPFAVWQVTSQSDEARYTVAAARMMASGEYIIPYSAWGEVRLLKPPLVYYQMVAGFALFGQSVFAVKSMWILTAALVLGLTWVLARAIGATRAGALVAVAALGSNILFYRGTLTHNPDMPMVFGITVAMLGFVRLVSDDRPPAWAAWAAWMGVAWAFLAKGMLVLLLVALALGLRAFYGRLRGSGRNEVAAIVAAVVASGWWWVVVAFREPEALVRQFFGDQVGRKAVFDPLGSVEAFAGLVGFMLLGFLPILLASFPLRRLGLPRLSPGVVLLGGWAALITALFSFGVYHPPRYLLPALPGVAAIVGLAFSGLDAGELVRRGGRSLRILLVLTLAVVLATVAIVYGGASVLAALGALAAGLAIIAAIWWLAGSGRTWIVLPLVALWFPVTVLLTWPAARILAFPAGADFGVAAVKESGLPTDEVVIFGRWRFLDRVGLRAPPLEGYRFSLTFVEEMLEGAGLVLSDEPRDAERLAAMGWTVRTVTGAPEGFGAGELWTAIRARDIAGLRETFGEKIYIATPPPGG